MTLEAVLDIVRETENKLKESNSKQRKENKRLKGLGFTDISRRNSRGWNKLSTDIIRARAYDKIVECLNEDNA